MKERLYYQDPYLKQFTAEVLERGHEADGTPYVILDQTAFYPTGGGQPCDLGVINDIEVMDVEEVDGQIHHRLRSSLSPEISRVVGTIDWDRRLDHMQQHTGQHLLTAAFEELFQAATVSFHLGKERVTIDLDIQELTEEMVQEAVALANRVAYENRPITASFMEPEELSRLPLRKPPTVTDNIRIVIIEDFDYNPCGGTHPARTGEAGPIQVLGWERSKGQIRVSFVCGLRVVRELGVKQGIIQQLTRLTSQTEAELPEYVSRMIAERKELEKSLQELQSKMLEVEAKEWIGQAETINGLQLLLIPLNERPMADMQKLAQHIVVRVPNVVVILVSLGAKTQLVCARGAEVSLAMNEMLKEALLLMDGKGGGQPAMAQGGGTTDMPMETLLARIRQIVTVKMENNPA
ncbi:alanyl-tRNA editing protein [Brevibacillus migulae]|uniref:alanyl-tRNA editing protein n=1 Tax=Brevibacillus migulae TaxID=1644114 RepID=UPI00106E12E5|nr:DHHA1 domain-containing protein [Brevibacillus migulae]